MSLLKILEGGFFSSAYEKIKEEIKATVLSGERACLIVPEQQAVTAERDIMQVLPPSAALSFEVTNFTRLSNSAQREVGGLGKEYSDSAREALIMWRTLTELSPYLKLTEGSGEISAGLVEKAMRAVREMKGISALPDELSKIAEDEKLSAEGRLKSKLNDISKIMALYESLVGEKYQSTQDDGEKLSKILSEHPSLFSGVHFFISGFTSFTEPQHKTIEELCKRGFVTVHLVISKSRESSFEFTEIRDTKSELIRRQNKASCDVKLEKIMSPRQIKSELLPEICELLWLNSGKIDNNYLQNEPNSLRIYEAGDVYSECEFVASDILRRVMCEGLSYSDFAIIARDAKRYDGILDTYLKDASIPYFVSKRADVSAYEAVKLIYTAFEAVTGGFSRGAVISYAKCRLSGISPEECDEFELYTERWQISGSRFTDNIGWNMSPDGFEARKSRDHDERLLAVNATRDKLIPPLARLSDSISSAVCVLDYAKALIVFFEDISLSEKMAERCTELLKVGEAALAEENSKLWEIIMNSLDALVDTLGDFKINAQGFLSLFKVVLSNADIGRIPAFCDEVTVGSADMLRLGDKKQVYLIGVNEGIFPLAERGLGYFTERDKITLEALGLNIKARDEISLARELFFFSRAFSSASDGVTLTYPKRDASFAALAPSRVITRICELLGKDFSVQRISDISLDEKLYLPISAIDYIENEDVRSALIKTGREDIINVAMKPISNSNVKLGDDTLSSLYPRDISLSQSRIDDFISCPFAYFLKYNIKLNDDEVATFDARNIGTFIHAVLEGFFAKLKATGINIREMTNPQFYQLLSDSASDYVDKALGDIRPTKRTEMILKRLVAFTEPIVDALCNELHHSGFVPEFFELKIGGDDEFSPKPTRFEDSDGKGALVYGSVDRVDAFKSCDDVYVKVIDYKTGSKHFSPSDLDEGRNLQMFLYLKAIVESDNEKLKSELGATGSGRIIPAAIIYIQPDMSDIKVDVDDEKVARDAITRAVKRRGMILHDNTAITAMGLDYIPVKFKMNGEPDARYAKYLYDEEGWNKINEKISKKVLEVASAMRGGDISPTKKPTKDNHCDTCKYKSICRKK